MDLNYSAEDRAFRDEVRMWIRTNLPDDLRDKVVHYHHLGRLVRSEPFPITSLPSEDEAHSFLGSFGLTVNQYTDEEKLLIVVAVKDEE